MNYLLLPFVEFEIRLGTIGKHSFDSSVDKKYFEKIKSVLETGQWESIVNKNTTEYVKDQYKCIDNVLMLKENIIKKDHSLSNSPFDIRFAINQEFSLKSLFFNKDSDTITRIKKRKSFIGDNFRYDLTEVNERNNNVNKIKYEIEIELLVNKQTLTWDDTYINDYIECKIYDLVNIVEPIERSEFKIKIQ
jgi:hypothetical protein